MKRWIKEAAIPAAAKLLPTRHGSRRVILCYHSVHSSKWFSSASPELFDTHLEWLKLNCDVVPLGKLVEACAVGSRPTVAITFDDGYLDNFEYAFPLLAKHRLPATFFVTVGLLEKNEATLARFKLLRHCDYAEIQPMEWRHAEEMISSGMDFGSHTYSHPNLAQIDNSAARLELTTAREIAENRLGRSVGTFAYPFGKPMRHFSPLTEALVHEAGYDLAVAVLFRGVLPRDSSLRLPRFFIHRDSIQTLAGKISGDWDPIGYWQEYAPMSVHRFLSRVDFERSIASESLITGALQYRKSAAPAAQFGS